MIRLVGDVAACRGGVTEKRRVLMDGLIRLVEAHSWLWTVSPKEHLKPGKRPVFTVLSHGGFEDGQFPRLLKAIDHPESWGIFDKMSREMKQRTTHLTWTRRQMDGEDQFNHKTVRPLWHAAGVGELMISACPLKTGELGGVGVYRAVGAPEFDLRHARIVHIVLAEVPWLNDVAWQEEEQPTLLPKLSPRRRTVLNLVLEGHSRKEMAAQLGISIHTLDGYVKDIFRHFGVHSQAGLIARFHSGENGKTPESGD
ncbi:helix-turn-helix transcriptional regulator [Haloferula sp. BvORR071]|uniref:helix-turn-helix transcriptional regulator n=1 Tax=Haloferula sp. BvORR071 TaxID=1396141 RepID=UPI002240F057|nr:helix-turn-helix transcriptional regulator [Haloferula sp. BvORR071]